MAVSGKYIGPKLGGGNIKAPRPEASEKVNVYLE
jgi:hypothetical protein